MKRRISKIKMLEHAINNKKLLKEFFDDKQIAQVYSQMLGKDYESFVNNLKGFVSDKKVLHFLRNGLKDGAQNDDKIKISRTAISVKDLIPTQNEIDVKKSLQYPLTSEQNAADYIHNDTVSVAGKDILVFNGKYIIDGHHRWSQVYVINPEAKITCMNMVKSGEDPLDILKKTQVAIAASTGDVPVATVNGINLLSASLQQLKQYIDDTMTIEVAKVLGKKKGLKNKGQVVNYIVTNCEEMKRKNKPIAGAPERSYMPQTDTIGDDKQVMNVLNKGIVNLEKPFIKPEQGKLEFQEAVGNVYRPIYQIAREIASDWKPVHPYAKPYLDAMFDLDKITDMYGSDRAESIIAYFLSNARPWKGEVAKKIKAELNAMIAGKPVRKINEARFRKIQKIKSLLESHTGKKVVLKEAGDYYENKYFQRCIERIKNDIKKVLRDFLAEVRDLGETVENDSNLKDCEQHLRSALNSITFE